MAEEPPTSRPVIQVPPEADVVRHLRRAGKGEIVISVPRSWVKRNELRIGESLNLQEAGPGRLLLEDPKVHSANWETLVESHPREPLEHLFRRLVSAYLTGTPVVSLTFPEAMSHDVRKTVREFARRSGRMEVVSEGARWFTLRDISGEAPVDALPLVSRIARASLELQRRARESLTASPSPEEDAYWETQDDEVDRLEWRVHRALASRALRAPALSVHPEGSSATLHLLAMARAFERIGDHAVRIARASASLPRPLPQPSRFRPVLEYHDQVLELMSRVIPLIERPDPQVANDVVDVAESLHSSRMALLQGLLSRRAPSHLPPLTAGWLTLVLDSVDRSAAYVADIAELTMDRAAVAWMRSRSSTAGADSPPGAGPPSVRPTHTRAQGSP